MIGWKKNIKDRQTVEMYGEKFVMLNNKIAPNRCPHRGASLCDGKLVNGRIECPFHKRFFSEETHPDSFGGQIMNDALWYGGRNFNDIPKLSGMGTGRFGLIQELLRRWTRQGNLQNRSEQPHQLQHPDKSVRQIKMRTPLCELCLKGRLHRVRSRLRR